MDGVDRTTFLAERQTGIGGSDCASLFNIGYGCERRLVYEKRGEIADYPFEGNDLTDLGAYLEEYICDKYARETGRRIEKVGLLRHRDQEELIVHIDRRVWSPDRDTHGVLEAKALGSFMWHKVKREGMVQDYLLQVQHGMIVDGATWGAFAVLNRDNGKLLYWDVEADQVIQRSIRLQASLTWGLIENGPLPERLDPDDKRCHSCPYRLSCQGAALMELSKEPGQYDESLRPLIAEWKERKELKDTAEELYEEIAEKLKAAVGDRTEVLAPGAKILYRPYERKEYTVKSAVIRALRVYPEKA